MSSQAMGREAGPAQAAVHALAVDPERGDGAGHRRLRRRRAVELVRPAHRIHLSAQQVLANQVTQLRPAGALQRRSKRRTARSRTSRRRRPAPRRTSPSSTPSLRQPGPPRASPGPRSRRADRDRRLAAPGAAGRVRRQLPRPRRRPAGDRRRPVGEGRRRSASTPTASCRARRSAPLATRCSSTTSTRSLPS